MDSDITTYQRAYQPLWLILWICYFIPVAFSCKSVERVAYFQDLPDTLLTKAHLLAAATYRSPIIRTGDLLQVNLYIQDTPLINSLAPPAGGMQRTVDSEGTIALPVLGKIKVAGLSTAQIQDTLHRRAIRFYKDPVVAVSLANFTVTVLGEVARPGNFTSTHEKISVLDALAMSGDISIYGKKENVLIIRNRDDQQEAVRLNLHTSAALSSPYFYLKQGDVVIVEPNKHKIAAARNAGNTRNYALIASGLSVFILFLSRL